MSATRRRRDDAVVVGQITVQRELVLRQFAQLVGSRPHGSCSLHAKFVNEVRVASPAPACSVAVACCFTPWCADPATFRSALASGPPVSSTRWCAKMRCTSQACGRTRTSKNSPLPTRSRPYPRSVAEPQVPTKPRESSPTRAPRIRVQSTGVPHQTLRRAPAARAVRRAVAAGTRAGARAGARARSRRGVVPDPRPSPGLNPSPGPSPMPQLRTALPRSLMRTGKCAPRGAHRTCARPGRCCCMVVRWS